MWSRIGATSAGDGIWGKRMAQRTADDVSGLTGVLLEVHRTARVPGCARGPTRAGRRTRGEIPLEASERLLRVAGASAAVVRHVPAKLATIALRRTTARLPLVSLGHWSNLARHVVGDRADAGAIPPAGVRPTPRCGAEIFRFDMHHTHGPRRILADSGGFFRLT